MPKRNGRPGERAWRGTGDEDARVLGRGEAGEQEGGNPRDGGRGEGGMEEGEGSGEAETRGVRRRIRRCIAASSRWLRGMVLSSGG